LQDRIQHSPSSRTATQKYSTLDRINRERREKKKTKTLERIYRIE
jgi:hypothetical protein